jgi:hypothetical protein
MTPAGFEPAIPASEGAHILALDRATTGIASHKGKPKVRNLSHNILEGIETNEKTERE